MSFDQIGRTPKRRERDQKLTSRFLRLVVKIIDCHGHAPIFFSFVLALYLPRLHFRCSRRTDTNVYFWIHTHTYYIKRTRELKQQVLKKEKALYICILRKYVQYPLQQLIAAGLLSMLKITYCVLIRYWQTLSFRYYCFIKNFN